MQCECSLGIAFLKLIQLLEFVELSNNFRILAVLNSKWTFPHISNKISINLYLSFEQTDYDVVSNIAADMFLDI